jgi:multiple sugar transport system ATP-binding protein
MTLGDRVAVMRKGRLQQLDAPNRLYREPVNLFVAEFIGSPAMNVVEATLGEANGGLVATFGEHELALDDELVAARPALRGFAGRPVALGIRPEDFEDPARTGGAAPGRSLPAVVDIVEDMGSEVFLHFSVDAPPVATADIEEAVEETAAVEAAREQAVRRGTPFVARVDRDSRAREGDSVQLAVDTRRLHLFDLETGEAIRDVEAA